MFATILDMSALYMCPIHLMLHLLQKHLDKSFFCIIDMCTGMLNYVKALLHYNDQILQALKDMQASSFCIFVPLSGWIIDRILSEYFLSSSIRLIKSKHAEKETTFVKLQM